MTSPSDPLALPTPESVTRIVEELRTGSPDFAVLFDRYRHAGPALRHYGIIRWEKADLAASLDAFRAAATLMPDDADLWRDLAAAFDANGEPAQAETCISTSIHHQPAAARSWLLLAHLKNKAGLREGARAAFSRALALDPTLGDAHFGLGMIFFERQEFDAAASRLRSAIDHGYANALGFAVLGHILYIAGRFAECASAFEDAARFGALDREALRKYAHARTLSTMIDGHPEQALARYPELAGPEAKDIADVLRDAFAVLCGYGHTEAAVALGKIGLAQEPDDATLRYLLDAARGQPLKRLRSPISKAISIGSPRRSTRNSWRSCATTYRRTWRRSSPGPALNSARSSTSAAALA